MTQASIHSGKRFNRQEAAQYLGLTSAHTLAVWACEGRHDLPFAKIGGKVVYFQSDLDAFIERNMNGKKKTRDSRV